MKRHPEDGARIVGRLHRLSRHRACGPPPPRALGRQRLPARLARRRDPARGRDRRPRRRGRRDDDGPPVQRAPDARRGDRRGRAQPRHAVRAGRRRRVRRARGADAGAVREPIRRPTSSFSPEAGRLGPCPTRPCSRSTVARSRPSSYREVRELYKTHSIAEDARDLEGLISTLTPDCVYELVQTGHRWEGHDGARALLHRAAHGLPGHRLQPDRHRDRAAGRVRGGERLGDPAGAVARPGTDRGPARVEGR